MYSKNIKLQKPRTDQVENCWKLPGLQKCSSADLLSFKVSLIIKYRVEAHIFPFLKELQIYFFHISKWGLILRITKITFLCCNFENGNCGFVDSSLEKLS